MQKSLISLFLTVALLSAASPALAGDVVDGDGYSLHLPKEFKPIEEADKADGHRIRKRFGTMPVDGVPTIKSFAAGAPEQPSARLVLSRIDLKTPVTTLSDLGLRQIEAMEARVPAGFEFKARKIGDYEAIEMQFSREIDGEAHTSRVLSVACGDYIVVVMLDTADERYRGADLTWTELVASIKVVPRMRGLILLGLIGLGVLALCGVFVHIARRHVRTTPDPWNSRFGGAGGATLPGSGLSGFALDGRAPARNPNSGVLRPPRRTPPSRQGLRNTLGQSAPRPPNRDDF